MRVPFDRSLPGFIQSLIAVGILWALTMAGCKKETPVQPDAGVLPVADAGLEQPADAGSQAADVEAAPDEGPVDAGIEPAEPTTGIQQEGDRAVAHAIGKAPKGHDISLSRDAAANRARQALLKLLKEKAIELPDGKLPEGVTIDRIWVKGKFIFAEASWPLPVPASGLNQSPVGPSNFPADRQPDAKGSPQGGTRP